MSRIMQSLRQRMSKKDLMELESDPDRLVENPASASMLDRAAPDARIIPDSGVHLSQASAPLAAPQDATHYFPNSEDPLLADWTWTRDNKGRVYYFNLATGATQWSRPGKNDNSSGTTKNIEQQNLLELETNAHAAQLKAQQEKQERAQERAQQRHALLRGTIAMSSPTTAAKSGPFQPFDSSLQKQPSSVGLTSNNSSDVNSVPPTQHESNPPPTSPQMRGTLGGPTFNTRPRPRAFDILAKQPQTLSKSQSSSAVHQQTSPNGLQMPSSPTANPSITPLPLIPASSEDSQLQTPTSTTRSTSTSSGRFSSLFKNKPSSAKSSGKSHGATTSPFAPALTPSSHNSATLQFPTDNLPPPPLPPVPDDFPPYLGDLPAPPPPPSDADDANDLPPPPPAP